MQVFLCESLQPLIGTGYNSTLAYLGSTKHATTGNVLKVSVCGQMTETNLLWNLLRMYIPMFSLPGVCDTSDRWYSHSFNAGITDESDCALIWRISVCDFRGYNMCIQSSNLLHLKASKVSILFCFRTSLIIHLIDIWSRGLYALT